MKVMIDSLKQLRKKVDSLQDKINLLQKNNEENVAIYGE